MGSLSIGRSRSCSVVVDAPTVSRHHADLTALSGDRFRFEDRGSTSGSYRLEAGAWQKFESAELSRTDRVRMGDFECSLDDLLGRVETTDGSSRDSRQTARKSRESKPPRTVIERDPATGQIVIRQR